MAGKPVWFDGTEPGSAPRQWTVPATTPTVAGHVVDWAGGYGVLATPEAVRDATSLPLELRTAVRPTSGRPDVVVEHVRNAVAPFGWTVTVSQTSERTVDTTYAAVRSALLLGALVVVLLAGLSLLVVAVEQLRERRRPLAVLAAGGVPRAVLARSLLWQNAVPVWLATLVAVAVGLGLGGLALRISQQPTGYDWSSVAMLVAGSLVAVLLVTASTLPALSRASAADGLRSE